MDFQAIHTYDDLVAYLLALPRRYSTLIVGVDGCGGSGKSTVARVLHEHIPDSTIIHMDDVYLPSALRPPQGVEPSSIVPSYDIARLHNDVLIPLTQNRDGAYQRYDWSSDQLAESHSVLCGGVVIVEGVASISGQLADFYNVTVWVECPYEIRLARGIERDGEGMRHFWVDVWMPAEHVYIRNERPDLRAMLRVDGSGRVTAGDPNALVLLPPSNKD